jgi:hypothetical protein
MNAQPATTAQTKWLRQINTCLFPFRRWWVILVVTAGLIVLAAFVKSWTECQYTYQVELDHYLSYADGIVRQPELRSIPLLTVLVRAGGQLLSTVGAWIGWAGGLYLLALLFGEREMRLTAILQVIAWSWLPYMLRSVIQCLYMWLTRDPIYNPGLSGLVFFSTPPPPGGGYTYLMPTSAQQFWAALLAHFDAYLFAQLALVFRGLRRAVRLQRKQALMVTTIVGLFLGAVGILTSFGGSLGRLRLF